MSSQVASASVRSATRSASRGRASSADGASPRRRRDGAEATGADAGEVPERPTDGDVRSATRRRAARGSGGAALGMRGLVRHRSGTALTASSRLSTAASDSPEGGLREGWWPLGSPSAPCWRVAEEDPAVGQAGGRTPTP